MRGKEPMSKEEDKPVTIQYELPTGAIAVLEEILKRPQWYKDDPKVGSLVKRARQIRAELPKTATRPEPEKDERQDAYDARVDAWATVTLSFNWTDKQKEVAKKCFTFYLKAGVFEINDNIVALVRIFGLDDE